MKLERKKEDFNPMVITLEAEEEATILWEMISRWEVSKGMEPDSEPAKKLCKKLLAWFCDSGIRA